MFGMEMLFKAIGLDDAAIAELRGMLDPEKLKAGIGAANARLQRLEANVDLILSKIDALESRSIMTEMAAQGGQFMHPNVEKTLNDALLQMADDPFIINGECNERTADDRSGIESSGVGANGSAN